MKYKDYYDILGVKRDATSAQIKVAYRKLAHKYHPDVSKDPGGEAKFKELAEAYQTLKDTSKRAAYDQLGPHQAGQEFRPPPDWETHFGGAPGRGRTSFDDVDLAELFAGLAGRHRGSGRAPPDAAMPGRDYDISAEVSLEDAYQGTRISLNLQVPDYDEYGQMQHVERMLEVSVPKGVVNGQKLRLRAQGGKGYNGGINGDLFLNLTVRLHRLFTVKGRDLYLNLPLSPWEAGLGAIIEIPTLSGAVMLSVPPGSGNARHLRVTGRGLPGSNGTSGDLFAVVEVVMPATLSERETALLRELAAASTFNPRTQFQEGGSR